MAQGQGRGARLQVKHVQARYVVLADVAALAPHRLVAAAAERQRPAAWRRAGALRDMRPLLLLRLTGYEAGLSVDGPCTQELRRAPRPARTCEDHDAYGGVVARVVKAAHELGHGLRREGVPPLRPIYGYLLGSTPVLVSGLTGADRCWRCS